jgi:eukaryotic-like serine/threonine-protein kinase
MLTPERWRKIEELYQAAKNCPPNHRAALLEATDPEIRARVERMLEIESSGGLLDQSPFHAAADPPQTVIAPGAHLGPYKIEAQIGSGGMGTVYRAVDTRLGRVVAIKIAAERYSVRFQLEAQAISTLNHPNICTLHDVGPNYLVMEFIDGSTLAAEFKKGPLPSETAARYGAQIASALAEAHSLGIVHRDLKPSNIMLTRHGVKVLDFGLAKILDAASVTQTDAVMGTPAYMAPEQVEGIEPGSATDLFSLGLVLYEMSVGRLPFPGASLGQMLSSGAHPAVPAPSHERAGVPASLDALVSKLLERDPARRPQSGAEVSRELTAIANHLSAPPYSPRTWLFAIPAMVLLLGFSVWHYLRSNVPASQPPIANPSSYTQLTSFTDAVVAPVLSPDGRMVAFYRSARGVGFGTPGDIWLKLLPDGEPIQVTHDARPKYNIAFSPDGAHIAYTVFPRSSQLFDTYIVPTLGGDSQLFLPNSAGLSWLDDNHLLFSQIKGGGIHMGIVTSNTDRSATREIYYPSLERGMAHYSYLSPDKKWIVLQEMNPAWGPCRVVPFSGESRGRLVGPPGAVCTSSAWSRDGKYLYLGVSVAGRFHIWRQPFPDGRPEQITFGSSDESGIALAPDGQSLITSVLTRQNAVWVHDSSGDRAISTQGYADTATPQFSRDGKRIYYLLRRASPESSAELWRADLDSAKNEVVIPGVSMNEFAISPDEKQVLFTRQPAGQASQLWIAATDRSAPPRQIGSAKTGSGMDVPHFGPTGQVFFRLAEGHLLYIATVSNDGSGLRKALPNPILEFDTVSPDGRFVIASMEVPGVTPPPTRLLPLDGTPPIPFCDDLCFPLWSPDGRYLSLQIADKSRQNDNARTAVIPLAPGKFLPRLTPELIHTPAAWAKMPGVKVVDGTNIALSLSSSTYAYVKPSVHANLFRVPLR